MKLNTCKHCHKVIISKLDTYTCPDCKEKDDYDFDKILNYLKQYPNSNAIQIADGLEISVVQILKYIDEGRLVQSAGTFEKI